MTDKKTPAETFHEMAERIEKNPKEFAGAYLIISPNGTIVSQAFFNPVGDDVAFWGFVSSQVQTSGLEAVQKDEIRNFDIRGRR